MIGIPRTWGIRTAVAYAGCLEQYPKPKMAEFQFNDAALANLKDKVVIVTG
jgi:hypothetical protein